MIVYSGFKRYAADKVLLWSLFLGIHILYLGIFFGLLSTGGISLTCITDECRYINFSRNLLEGFYSPPAPEINLWSGPGYPIFLMPFVFFEASKASLVFVNVLLSLVAIILLYMTSRIFLSRKYSSAISLIWSLYYPYYQDIYAVLSEPLTVILVLSVVFFGSKHLIQKRLFFGILSGLFLCFLILTKVIFSYVLIIAMLISFLIYFKASIRTDAGRLVLILSTAFLVTLPYQYYTYNLTGKIYYFANSGGSALYFMASPHPGEFGDWNNPDFTANCGNAVDVPCNSEKFEKNHAHVFEGMKNLDPIESDDYLKNVALENIKNNPIKYMKNYLNNISRILFNIPNSYFYQREQTILRLFPNSFLLTFIVFAAWFTLTRYRRLPLPVLVAISFVALYLALQLLVSSYPRQLHVVLPVIMIWIGVVCNEWLRGLSGGNRQVREPYMDVSRKASF